MTAIPKPMKKEGKHSLRWKQWQGSQRAVVSRRQHGHCAEEGCREPAEWHHCFRRHQLKEPLSSHHTMTVGLCKRHHRELHANPNTASDSLYQWGALDRAFSYFNLELDPLKGDQFLLARYLEAQLEAEGVMDILREQAGYR